MFSSALRGILSVASPQEVREIETGSIQRAQEHYRKGFPILSLFSHMSREDGPHDLKFLAEEFPDRRGKIVMPIALHTHTSLKPVLKLTDIAYGVDWRPIVTQRTIQEKKGKSTIEGLRAYLEQAMNAFQSGGIVSAALQAGGDLHTYGEPTTVFSTLARRIKRINKDKGVNNQANVGIQFIGIIPKHSLLDGRNAHGSQTLRTMRLHIGEFALLNDVWNEVGDEPKSLDLWAHRQMKSTLPDWYTKS